MIKLSESQEPKQEEVKVYKCEACKYWALMGVNPQIKMAFGACTNEEFDEAPFGAMMSHFGSCNGFEERPKVAVPKKIISRLG